MNNKPIILAMFCLSGSVAATDTFFESVSQGGANVSLRYRFETVDQDGFDI